MLTAICGSLDHLSEMTLVIDPEVVDHVLGALHMLEEQNSQIFPFEPLARMVGVESRAGMADILDISVDLVKRFEQKGLSVDEADKLACKIHLHPMFVWREWMDIQPIDDVLLDMVEAYIEDKKKCASCGDWKPLENFFKRSKSNDGLGHKCKTCALTYERDRRNKLNDIT